MGLLGALFLVDVLFAPPDWWTFKLEDYQRQRLLVYFGARLRCRQMPPPKTEPKRKPNRSNKSYQVRQALISVGTGGLFWERLASREPDRAWVFAARRGAQ